MTVYIRISNKQWFDNNELMVKVEWKYPCLPQTGEEISSALFLDHIDKNHFFDTISGKGKQEIVEHVKNFMYKNNIDKKKAENKIFESWLNLFFIPQVYSVRSLVWGLDDEDNVSVNISIEMTS